MSKEREFLKKLRYASLLENDLRKELDELLAQPEPFKPDWANYRQGVADSKREPLSVEVIDELATKDAFYGGVFDFRIFARAIERAHGIG